MKEKFVIQTPEPITIYRTTTGLFTKNDICIKYKIGDLNECKNIQDNVCYKITKNDINKIKTLTSNMIQINYMTIFDLQLVLSFTVYVDINHNNKLYITNEMCKKYNIETNIKRIIKQITYCEVNENDIKKIENKSKSEKLLLKRKYVEIELKDRIEPAQNLFMYYHNIDTNEFYINRQTLELIRKNGIDITVKPIIIENRNCYRIDPSQLHSIENNTHTRGVERIIKPSTSDNKVEKKQNNTETIIVYKDKSTNRLYIPTKHIVYSQSTIKIMNKIMRETSYEELEKIKNKKFIIVDTYIYRPREYNIIICKNQDQLFIPQKMLKNFNITKSGKKILVNKEVYIEITPNELDEIKKRKERINIIYKNITPVN